MGIPFEALLPYGIMIGLFGVTVSSSKQLKRATKADNMTRASGCLRSDTTQTTRKDQGGTWIHGRDRVRVCKIIHGILADLAAVMARDLRITGVFRGQSDAVEAPAGFEGMFLAHSLRYSLTKPQSTADGRYVVNRAIGLHSL
jgi:hypothetical protein